jgi:hypothetical protein
MASSSNGDDVITLPRSEWRTLTGPEEALAKVAPVPGPDAAFDRSDALPDSPETYRSRPRYRRRPLRALVRYAVAVGFGVVATLAWQSNAETAKLTAAIAEIWGSYGEPAQQRVSAWLPNVWRNPPSTAAPQGQPTDAVAEQAQPQAPIAERADAGQPAERTDPGQAAERQDREALASELAGLRKAIERIAANQDRMGRELAKLQTSEPGARQTVMSAVSGPGPRPAPNQVPSQVPSQLQSPAPGPSHAASAQSRRPAPPPIAASAPPAPAPAPSPAPPRVQAIAAPLD